MWQQIGEDLRGQAPRLALRPCEACPLYQLPELHPLTATAISVDQMLTGGPLGREQYRLTRIEMTEEEFKMFFQPMLQEWRSITAKYEAIERAKAAKQNTVDSTHNPYSE